MRGARPVKDQRGQQRAGDDRPHRGAHHELPESRRDQILGPGQRGRRDQIGHQGDAVDGNRIAGQPVRPADGADGPLGQQHAGGEPGRVGGRPVQEVHAFGGVDRQQPPAQTRHRDRRNGRHPGPHREPVGSPRQDRQRQIEAHLHREAPHLGEARGQRQRHVNLRQRQVGQPDREAGVVGLGQQGQDHHHGDQISRHDPDQSGAQVVPGGRAVPQPAGGRGVAAPQQEPRQREEHCNG